jgi:glutathione synthase/RimK-type ligase-like ATP-grasp enzyme
MKKVKLLALAAHSALKEAKTKLAKHYEVELTTAQFNDIEMVIKPNNISILCNNIPLEKYNFVWVKSSWVTRAIAYTITCYLNSKNIPHTNVEREKSKLVDTFTLADKDIRVPTTYFCVNSKIDENKDKIIKICGLPLIIKVTRGSLGKGVFLIKSREDFDTVQKKLRKKKHYICQSFIPNDFDYRVIIGNDKILSVDKRIPQNGEYRNNAYLGAKEVFIGINETPEDIKSLAIESAKALNLKWTGIDIITSNKTGKSYVLELNRRPGLTPNSSETQAAFTYITSLLEKENLLNDS